jgi:hypothetical protein
MSAAASMARVCGGFDHVKPSAKIRPRMKCKMRAINPNARALSFFRRTSPPTWLAKHKKYDSREDHGDAKGGHQDTPLPQRAETSD